MQQEKNSKNSPRFGFIYRRGLFFNYFATECFKASLSPPASHSSVHTVLLCLSCPWLGHYS